MALLRHGGVGVKRGSERSKRGYLSWVKVCYMLEGSRPPSELRNLFHSISTVSIAHKQLYCHLTPHDIAHGAWEQRLKRVAPEDTRSARLPDAREHVD